MACRHPLAVETQFERELRRRGMDANAPAGSAGDSYSAAPRSPFEQQQRAAPRPPPSFRGQEDDNVPPQLQYSRALNSEGLEVRQAQWADGWAGWTY